MKNVFFFTVVLFSIAANGQKFHTEFEYADFNKGITIQNSYPKGGLKYTSPNGREYAYVIFWTRITNKTDADLEIKINFSADSFIIPSSPNPIFNLYVPREEMTLDKEPLLNYGLDLKSFLDENIGKPSGLVQKILPNKSHLFYTVAVSDDGVIGVMRAGFELKNEDLIYKINGYEIKCGKIIIQK